MSGRAVSELLGLPLRMHGIPLGKPVEALLDRNSDRLLGFEIVCGDGAHRFLPYAVTRIGAGELTIDSALILIDEADLEFYRRHCRRLADAGFSDPWVDEDGTVYEALSAA